MTAESKMAEHLVPAEVGDTPEEGNETPEGMEPEFGSIPSEFDIASVEVRRIQAAQSFDLGSDSAAAMDIFNRPEESDEDPAGEGKDAERYVEL